MRLTSQRATIAIVYVSAMFMSVLDTTIVTVALPTIAHDFGETATAAGIIQIAYLTSLTVMLPVSGWLGDRIGGKRALLGSIALFTLGSALCGMAPSLTYLVVFSIVQGVGGAIMLPVGLAILFRVYPPHERVRLSATLALVTALGPALGPILGGVFTTYASWRLIFFVNVPLGLAVVAWGTLHLEAHRQPHPGRLDVAGLALAALGLGALVLGVSEGPARGCSDPLVLGALIVGALALVALVPVERRSANPLIALRLFRNRLFTTATSLYGLASVAYIGGLYLIAVYLQNGLGASALVSGLTSVASALGIIVGGQLVSRVLYPRFGPRRILAAGLALIAASLVLVTLTTDLWWIRVDLFVLGLGVAGVFIPSQAISMATIPKTDTSNASPLFNAGKQLGSAIGVALTATVIALVAPFANTLQTASASLLPYHVAFLAAACVAAASIAVAFAVHDSDARATIVRRPAKRDEK
ncbi:MDR family MFS transporter [Kocuria rhizophila]|uniref:MDR family MFS transporter n=1 Tax=Kocuria rhizophila TaxID=72000 RepID=UPI0034DB1A51